MRKKVIPILYILFVFISCFILCIKGAYLTNDTIKVITADQPNFGKLKLDVEETILLEESDKDDNFMFRSIADMAVDSVENLFLLDFRRILKYNNNGQFVAKIGEAGQGPGEYNLPRSLFVDKMDNLYVNDGVKLVIFDNKGSFIKNVPFGRMIPGKVFIDEGKNIYGISRGITGSGVSKILRKYDDKGQNVKDIVYFPDWEVQIKANKSGGVMGGSTHYYSCEFLFSPLLSNRMCYSESLYYKIYVADLSGKVLFVIEKKDKPQKISSKEMDEFKRLYGKEIFKGLVFPPHRPVIEKILTDERGRIYVVRKKSILDSNKSEKVDIFNGDGRYLYAAEFPYMPIIFKDDCFYVIDRDFNDKTIIKKIRIKKELFQ